VYDKTPLQTLDFHRSMLFDEERCLGYMQAIFKTVRPGDIVLGIGFGTRRQLDSTMSKADRRALIAAIAIVLIALAVAWAGSQGGITVSGIPGFTLAVGLAFVSHGRISTGAVVVDHRRERSSFP
jgi:hypothetical protein